ncbi:PR-1-like protein [Lizonia empirigonia]|nr:PR-1-like protein [Lizonia empirigonia]
MHSSTLLASALAVGALALPNQLEKRQAVTVYDTVTVTVTVLVNPYATPAWTPPQFSQTPPVRPPNAPPLSIPPAPSVGIPVPSSPSVNGPAVPSITLPTAVPSVGPSHISGPSQATLSVGAEYQAAILYHHNAARANHGAGPLVWNDTVAQTASLAANTCNFAHYLPQGAGQGQNLFTVSGNYFNVTAGITESWYKGEFQAMLPYFGQASLSDSVFHNVGHLTQVLWKGTTSVGCVSLDCGANMIVGGAPSTLNKYTVCNYYPAGNVGGQYAINVGLPISTSPAALGSWSD